MWASKNPATSTTTIDLGRCPGGGDSLQGSTLRSALPALEIPAMNIHLIRQRRTPKSKTKDGRPKVARYYQLQWQSGGTTPSGKPKLGTQQLGRVTKARAEELRREKIAELAGGSTQWTVRRGPALTLGRFAQE